MSMTAEQPLLPPTDTISTKKRIHAPMVNSVGSLGSKLVFARAASSFTLDRSAATYSGRGYCRARDEWYQVIGGRVRWCLFVVVQA